MSGVSKFTAERNQRILLDLVSKPGNDVCADCKVRTPRWASHNLGIFICMNCASIHRKIGTHITKVKSVTMDSWSREQVEVMKSIGNVASNAKYNPNEARHPPPANREESERDSELEKFIRWKYEFKRFMDKPGASTLKVPPVRAQSTPAASMARRSSPLPPVPTSSVTKPTPYPAGTISASTTPAPPYRQPSVPPSAPPSLTPPTPSPAPALAPSRQPAPNPLPKHPVWDDMMSLANPGLPMSSMPAHSQLQVPGQFQQPTSTSPSNVANTLGTNPFPSTMVNPQLSGRSVSLPVINNPFPTHHTQPQPSMGNPFIQQPSGYPGQMHIKGTPFQASPSVPVQVPSLFGQVSSSPFSHSYTPPSAFPQQQQFVPSSFPQQIVQPSHIPAQQTLQTFPQQPPMQGRNPFGAPTWQQQHSEQPPYGPWGGTM